MKKLIFAALILLVLWAMDFRFEFDVHFKQPNPLPDTSELVKSRAMLDSIANKEVYFFKRFSQLAVAEQRTFGIPASVYLGVAAYMSHYGRSSDILKRNNVFSLKGLDGVREYDNTWLSFRDFSNVVNSKNIIANGYDAFLTELDKSEIFDAPIKNEVSKIIVQYGLDKLDNSNLTR